MGSARSQIDRYCPTRAVKTNLGVAVADQRVVTALAFEEVERSKVAGVRSAVLTVAGCVISVGKAATDHRVDPGEGVGSDIGGIASCRAEGMTRRHVDGHAVIRDVKENLRVAVTD